MNETDIEQNTRSTSNVLCVRGKNKSVSDISLDEFFNIIWRGKLLILICGIIFGIIGGTYIFFQPNIYRSDVLLAPASIDSSTRLASIASQFGGLASLAGINLNSGSGTEKVTYALEVLQSRRFIGNFIKNHNLQSYISAVKGWDKLSRKFIYSNKFNVKEMRWKDDIQSNLKPTLLDEIKKFKSKFLQINVNSTTHMVSLSVSYYSPFISKEWVMWLVADLNNNIRQQDMVDAQNSITYLNQQIHRTSLTDARSMLYQLVEQQIKTLMLTKVRREYVFKIVDPAISPEKPYSPNRILIIFCCFFIGVLCMGATLYLRVFFKRKVDGK